MKKLLFTIFTVFILFFMNACSNSEIIGEEGLYAFTNATTDFDEFAKDDLSNHLFTYHGYVNDSMKLGRGITVYGNEILTVLYPVWQDEKIIGVYNVIFYKEKYSGSYSDGNTAQLNYAIDKTNPDNPLKLFKTDSGFYYSIGNSIYSMTGSVGEVIDDFKVKSAFSNIFESVQGKSVNVEETLEYTSLH